MGRICTVCNHDDALEINEALIIEGASLRDIARRYEVSKDAVQRHQAHIPQLLVDASRHTDAFEADSILLRIEELQRETLEQLEAAKEGDEGIVDRRLVLQAIREQRSNIELAAKVRQLIHAAPQINIINSSQWIELKSVIFSALEEFPEAKEAV